MTVKDLRTLVDNLDEYIHVPGGIVRLKKTILHLAVSGQLVPQDSTEGTGQELYDQIQVEKQKLIHEGKLKKQNPFPEITEAEIPFEIPKTWKWVRLGNLMPDFQNGASSRGDSNGKSITVLRLADIKDRRISLADTRQILIEESSIARYQILEGDILITRVNGSADIVGQFNLCDQAIDAIYCDHFIRMRIDRRWINPKFCALLGESSLLRNSIKNLFITTAGQKTVNQRHVGSLMLPLIPTDEQKRVVDKVSQYFKLIDELAEKYKTEQEERTKLVKSSLAKLSKGESTLALDMLADIIKATADADELRKTILRLAVSGQLVSQDPSEGTGQQLYDQIQTEKQNLIAEGKLKKQKPLPEITEEEVPFEIPESWKWIRLGDVTNYGTAEKIKASAITPKTWILELEDIEKISSRLIERVWSSNRPSSSDKNVFQKGDVLYGKLRPYLDKVLVAESEGICTTEILPLRAPGALIHPTYLWLYLKSPDFITAVNDLTYGVKMPRLGTSDGRLMPMQFPPFAEQDRIAQNTTKLLDLVDRLGQLVRKQNA